MPMPTPHTVSRPPAPWRLMLRALVPRRRPPGIDGLPELLVEEQSIPQARLNDYLEVCGFPKTEHVPLSYLFVAGFMPQVLLVTDARFPLKALGMVHIGNRFELLQPIRTGSSLTVKTRAVEIETVAKGRQVTVETMFFQGGVEAARSTSVNFARGGGHGRPSETKAAAAPEDLEPIQWQLEPTIGKRYARVSGDYNPIHLYGWSARLLGFRRPIAHGMYLVGRALADIERSRQESGETDLLRRLDVRFKTPTFLPSRSKLYLRREAERYYFELWNQAEDRPHVVGECAC